MNRIKKIESTTVESGFHSWIYDLLKKAGEIQPMPANDSDIEELAAEIPQSFPKELRQWLMICNSTLHVPGSLFGIKPEKDWLDISRKITLYPEWKKLGWTPIGDDGCGNVYVLVNDENGLRPIVFIEMIEGSNQLTYTVASELFKFLFFMLTEEAAFLKEEEERDRRWPFDKEWVVQHDPNILSVTVAPLPWNV